MQLLIIGGSGRTGKLIIEQSLERGHKITALLRDPTSFDINNPNLTITTGTPLNELDIERAMTSSPSLPEAVVIALASVRKTDSPFSSPASPPRLMADSHTNTLSAMKKHGIKRIITISAFGVGDSKAYVFWPVRMLLYHSNIAFAYEDHNIVENIVRESGLDWTLVKPAMLDDKAVEKVTVYGQKGENAPSMPGISRASVAAWAIEECVEGGKWIQETPVIAR